MVWAARCWAGVIAGTLFAASASAQTTTSRSPRARRVAMPPGKCQFASCVLPVSAVVTGAGSGAYVIAWSARRGELPVAMHVGGALFGGLSVVTSILYVTTKDPAPRYPAFGAIATMAVGAPALLLGLHGLISADAARDADKPLPPPNWYAASPVAILDARGAASPGLGFAGAF